MTKDIPHVRSSHILHSYWLFILLILTLYIFINLLINLTAPCYQGLFSVTKQIIDDILIICVQYILKEDVQTVFSDFLTTVLILYIVIKCSFFCDH